ncbi:MAG TPA: hypothetical protein VFC19_11690 [Candidatus Limnocylindrales bacterium]|nr:hypothetical protein [Candidatus Limnocylindrales bacterium]
MTEQAVQIFWAPAGSTMPSLGSRALLDTTDGDTPNLRMPVRMLSVDTPEVTARTEERAREIDHNFQQLATWIREGQAPIDARLAEFMLPKLDTGKAGTLQFEQGQAASVFAKQNMENRLLRPDGTKRNLFIRTADAPFDDNSRLLAYLAPTFSRAELAQLTRQQRSTFNLDLVTAGHAAPFVIYPSIPSAPDLALLIRMATEARAGLRGIWSQPATLLAYEYRAMEKLFHITRKKVSGQLEDPDRLFSWRERYCADMTTRVLHDPDDYFGIQPEHRLWIWPDDLNEAVARLNLSPAPRLAAAE